MYEVMGDPHESRKFKCQTLQASSGPSCKAYIAQEIKADNEDVNGAYSNMPDNFRSSIITTADKRVN